MRRCVRSRDRNVSSSADVADRFTRPASRSRLLPPTGGVSSGREIASSISCDGSQALTLRGRPSLVSLPNYDGCGAASHP
eukprot:scaffold204518_cov18-Tisochrysis_lutea.AAC.1